MVPAIPEPSSSRRTSGQELHLQSGATTILPSEQTTPRKQSNGTPQSQSQMQMQKELAEAEAKRRKIQRACDACRRKKIKCDGPMNSLSTSKCAHCQEYKLECTYVEAAKRRGPPKGYLETLEQRCGRLERMVHQLHPSIDVNKYAGPQPDRDDFDLASYQENLRSLHIPPYPSVKPVPQAVAQGASMDSSASSPTGSTSSPSHQILGLSSSRKTYSNSPAAREDSDEEAQLDIAKGMKKLSVKDNPWRYHGKASGAHLMRTFQAMKYKDHAPGTEVKDFLDEVNRNKRAHFWQIPEWELVIANEGIRSLDYSVWPDKGLDVDLIDAYFDNLNIHLPLLNRNIFMRQYESGLWKSSAWFAKVCLMIFANGSRYVDDDRIYWPKDFALTEEGKERLRADRDGTMRYSAGWKYLHALLRAGRSLMQGPNLYEFQCQVLLCVFLQGSAVPHATWIVSGVGLRSAQEIGIHIRSTVVHIDPIERAMYNRAFWCLYHIDRINCAGIGRSVAIQDSDFDADYPIDVDDDYWDTGDPEADFKQPKSAGISSVAAFIQTLKLDHILSATLRTIYAVNQAPGQSADLASKRAIVIELDSALNSWADGVPDELRWDPTRTNYRLFQQSAVLYVHYYYCQILIHRPFIPTPKTRDSGSASLPSLAVCANASRSICNIIDVTLRRGRQSGALPGRAMHPSFMLPSWFATILLLINIYTGKQSPAERERAVADIRKCLAMSREMELIWRQAGKMTDMMVELATEHDMPVATPPSHGEKRTYTPETSNPSSSRQSPSAQGSTLRDRNQSWDQPWERDKALAPGSEFDEERLVHATTSSPFVLPLSEQNREGVQALAANYSNYLGGQASQTAPAAAAAASSSGSGSGSSAAPINDQAQGITVPSPFSYQVPVGNTASQQYQLGNLPGAGLGMAGAGPLETFGGQPQAQSQAQALPSYLNPSAMTFPPDTGAGASGASASAAGIFDNNLFDIAGAGFQVPGQGEESDMWAQLFSEYTGQNLSADWSFNQPSTVYSQSVQPPYTGQYGAPQAPVQDQQQQQQHQQQW